MEVNLSEKTIETVLNALRCARTDLRRQLHELDSEITRRQLHDVNDALDIFDELDRAMIDRMVRDLGRTMRGEFRDED